MKLSFQLIWFNGWDRAQFGPTLTCLAQAVDQGGFDWR